MPILYRNAFFFQYSQCDKGEYNTTTFTYLIFSNNYTMFYMRKRDNDQHKGDMP